MPERENSLYNKLVNLVRTEYSDLRIIPFTVFKSSVITTLLNLIIYLLLWALWLAPVSSDIRTSFNMYILYPFGIEILVWGAIFGWHKLGQKYKDAPLADSWLYPLVGAFIYSVEFGVLAIFFKHYSFGLIYFAAIIIMCAMHSTTKWITCGIGISILESVLYAAGLFDKLSYPLNIPHKADIIFTIHSVLSIGLLLGIVVFIRKDDNNRMYLMEAQSKAKSEFLANMSHEIRTPINAILGMNEMILREDVSKEVEGYSLNIQKAGDNLLNIINSILDFSKIEAGKEEVTLNEYSLYSLLNDCFQMTCGRAQMAGLDFEFECDPTLPSKLKGDEQKLRQVILNLLTNAIKYTREGSVKLSVIGAARNNRLWMKIDVADTGVGISPENQEKLFSAFQRVDIMNNRAIEGTGLGLIISKEYAELMDGQLTVTSKVDEGSTFSIELPQEIADSTPIGPINLKKGAIRETKAAYSASFVAPNKKILVVDDVSLNIKVICGLLKPTRIMIDTAENGASALDLASERSYDLILLDHMMPEMDGVETLKRLKEMNSPNKNTPVIALTANAIAGAKEEYLSYGFDDYLAKPVSGKALEDMIKQYILN